MKRLTLAVVTPDGIKCELEADSAAIPAADGSVGVLPGHCPMIAALKEGVVWYRAGEEEHTFSISGGTAGMSGDRLVILTDTMLSLT